MNAHKRILKHFIEITREMLIEKGATEVEDCFDQLELNGRRIDLPDYIDQKAQGELHVYFVSILTMLGYRVTANDTAFWIVKPSGNLVYKAKVDVCRKMPYEVLLSGHRADEVEKFLEASKQVH